MIGRTSVALLLACGMAACLPSQPTAPVLIGEGRRALFIGNSYLYTADIPGIVQAMAEAAGGDKLAVETVAGPDMALIDHWFEGTSRTEIAKGGWDWVVLQQGPSSTVINRDSLRLVTRMFADEIAKVNGASPALFSAWPMQSRVQDFPRAIESYSLAASDVGGVFIPVASAWESALVLDGDAGLYADGLHPSAHGAYLSALVVYACLLKATPLGLPSQLTLRSGRVLGVSASRATMLQQTALGVLPTHCKR
jgi:hypothetical protein